MSTPSPWDLTAKQWRRKKGERGKDEATFPGTLEVIAKAKTREEKASRQLIGDVKRLISSPDNGDSANYLHVRG